MGRRRDGKKKDRMAPGIDFDFPEECDHLCQDKLEGGRCCQCSRLEWRCAICDERVRNEQGDD